jgi:hypothetical protein
LMSDLEYHQARLVEPGVDALVLCGAKGAVPAPAGYQGEKVERVTGIEPA